MRPSKSVMLQLKGFVAWSATGPDPKSRSRDFSLLDYVSMIGTADSIFAFAELFCPDTTRHEGRFFIAAKFSVATYDEWIRHGTSPADAQRVMNHLHIASLVQDDTTSDETAIELARVISEVWRRTLSSLGVMVETEGVSYEDVSVTFYNPGA